MEKQISYKTSGKFTPKVIEEVIEVQENKGLTPENLLEKAKKKSSNLHGFFDWNDQTAGDKWRLQQARLLINEIKVIVEDKEMYAFENVAVEVDIPKDENKKTTSQTHKREYKPIVEIMNNEEYRSQLIERAVGEVSYWKERHSELTELKPLFESIEEEEKKWLNKK